ncbi:alpha,alpha-phosphotrehalase [Ligilactobacillus salivarius]|uniref:Alpha,alpha-phosphotrehalase n=1 Tax=Ligilactobacillus salivarius TaxID=1624 RepID=A0A1D7TQU6_9LACO|nr:alpha,alpha-phosphotrehalase [Ligilactobacillus salivarius]AOO73352.1 alpha,alpha-phosphotrehalase [Ligilactobacillus salivarius]UDE97077.1 alpha,alpha-phosphotrehalase [Ligilactobacillus salivarius]UUV96199.1 alpha,alpha-phosphotrehalase [Ligilactobacillus salivarius]
MTKLGQKVIYQIYPKSFYDSNNDGFGDLQGIIAKIDYLKKLNIDMIWFNPFYVSPQNDNGYDIADYYKIDKRFGTMEDFEKMVAKLKEANIGVMLDMVLNHCSTEHEWFQKALAGNEKYQKYFYLRPAKADGSLPTNWQSKFGGPAWEKFGDTDLYYLHLYDKTQADLDWHNPDVRAEAAKIVNFWKEKGVAGFRFDVLNVIGKDEVLVDSIDSDHEKPLYTDTPIVHKYIKELNRNTFGTDPEIVTVGEMSSTTIPNSIEYTNPDEHELSMVFTFHHLKVDYDNGEKWSKVPFNFMELKSLLSTWQTEMDKGHGWNALFWNNHDQPWALNRFGDPVNYREKSAEMLATSLHLLRGTPYIYMGEELGMIDPHYKSIDDYVDVETLNGYQMLLDKGVDKDRAFEIVVSKSRDNSRVPMHWDDSKYAGFSNVKPWLMPTDQDEINVEKELASGEIFNHYQKLINLRKTEPLVYAGHFKELLPDNKEVFAYERYLDDSNKKLVVFNNFYSNEVTVDLPAEYQDKDYTTLVDNYQNEIQKTSKQITLQPYESLAIKI